MTLSPPPSPSPSSPDLGAPKAARKAPPPLLTPGVAAPIASAVAFAAMGSLSFPLIALLLERAGVNDFWIGVNSAVASIAMIAAAPVFAPVMQRLGAPRFLLLCLGVTAAALLSLKVWESYAWWLVGRFILGASISGLYLASEYWIVAAAPAARKGRIVAVYAMAVSGGYLIGPVILSQIGVEGWAPFLLGAALCLVAAVPAHRARRSAPVIPAERPAQPLRFFRTDPTPIWGVALFGALEFGVMGLAPVWATRLGMSEAAAIAVVIALGVGNIGFQPLIGRIAERAQPRLLMAGFAVVCIGTAVTLPLVADAPWALYPVIAIWGGAALGLYTVALTTLGERYDGDALAGANAALVTAYGLGALAGPLATGASMNFLGPHGLSVALGGLSLAFLALVGWRAYRRPRAG